MTGSCVSTPTRFGCQDSPSWRPFCILECFVQDQHSPPQSLLLGSFLNGLEVVNHRFRIASIKPERRHIRMNGTQPILQTLSEITVVKLVLTKRAERRRVSMRAAALPAHGVTRRTELLKQCLSVPLLAIECMAGPAAHERS
jgi:hypothetical protein